MEEEWEIGSQHNHESLSEVPVPWMWPVKLWDIMEDIKLQKIQLNQDPLEQRNITLDTSDDLIKHDIFPYPQNVFFCFVFFTSTYLPVNETVCECWNSKTQDPVHEYWNLVITVFQTMCKKRKFKISKHLLTQWEGRDELWVWACSCHSRNGKPTGEATQWGQLDEQSPPERPRSNTLNWKSKSMHQLLPCSTLLFHNTTETVGIIRGQKTLCDARWMYSNMWTTCCVSWILEVGSNREPELWA